MLSYNVFRHRERDLLCAVPEDRPVPSFLTDKGWEFTGKIAEESRQLPPATVVAARFNGFYVFRPFQTIKDLTGKAA